MFQDDTPTSLGLVSWTVIGMHITRPVVASSSSHENVEDKDRAIKDLSDGTLCVCFTASCVWFLSAVVDYPLTETAMRLQNIKIEVEEKTVAMTTQKKRKVDCVCAHRCSCRRCCFLYSLCPTLRSFVDLCLNSYSLIYFVNRSTSHEAAFSSLVTVKPSYR